MSKDSCNKTPLYFFSFLGVAGAEWAHAAGVEAEAAAAACRPQGPSLAAAAPTLPRPAAVATLSRLTITIAKSLHSAKQAEEVMIEKKNSF